MSAELIDFDPNMVYCGRMAMTRVRLTFGRWKYRATREVTVVGNVTGLEIIECAVSAIADELIQEDEARCEASEGDEWEGHPYLELTWKDGETTRRLIIEEVSEDYLKDIVVAAEIVGFEPE